MNQSKKLLVIVVLEMGIVVLSRQILGDFPVAPGEVELVAFTRTAHSGQPRLIS
ncbi:hypothetical protein D3C73_1099600 [compost metagenome]